MEDSSIDPAGLVVITQGVLLFMQTVKKSAKIKNSSVPILSLFVGLVLGLLNAGLGGAWAITEGGFAVYVEIIRYAVTGVLGGAGAVTEYDVQKRLLGEHGLPPAPDNHTDDATRVAGGGARGSTG